MAPKKPPPQSQKRPPNPKKTNNSKVDNTDLTFKLIVYTECKQSDILHRNDVRRTKKKITGRWGEKWYPITIVHQSGKILNHILFTKNSLK